MSLGWPGNASGSPRRRAGGSVWGEGSLGISAQTAASATRSRTKRMKKKKKKECVDLTSANAQIENVQKNGG
ncbi:hypothetical protein L3Q82_026151 [Scortum barcoo]|uniref:Uncharacterized protein n=1 Tax=Scortum barcoo TaxID=214431 RepID=A0ACB8WN45_9TELE|nr:hypothetical protein L3Q82_026151 [Scortum barcoo]